MTTIKNHVKKLNNLTDSKSPYYNENDDDIFIKIAPQLDYQAIDDNDNYSFKHNLYDLNDDDNNRKIPFIYYKSKINKRKCKFSKKNLNKDNRGNNIYNGQYINKSIDDINISHSNSSSPEMPVISKTKCKCFNEKNENDNKTLEDIINFEKYNKLKNFEIPNTYLYQKDNLKDSQRKNKFDDKKKEIFKKRRPALSKIIIRAQNNKSYDCQTFKEQYGLNKKKKKNKKRNNTPNILEDSIKGTPIKKENDREGKLILHKNDNHINEKNKNNILLKNGNIKNNENDIYNKNKLNGRQYSKNKKPNYAKNNVISISINQMSAKEPDIIYKTNHYVYLKRSYFRYPRFENSNNNFRNKKSSSYEIMTKRNIVLEKRKLTPDFNRKYINSPLQITGENSFQLGKKIENERKNIRNLFNTNNNNISYIKYNKNNNNSIFNKPSNLKNINNNKNYKNKLNNGNYINLKIQNYNHINNDNDNDSDSDNDNDKDNDNDFQNQNSNNINSYSYGYNNKTNDISNEVENDSNNIDTFNNNSIYNSSANDDLNNSLNNNKKNNNIYLKNNGIKKKIYSNKNQNNLNNLKNSQSSNESYNKIDKENEVNANNYYSINNNANEQINNNFLYYSNSNQNNSINNKMNKSNNSFDCTKVSTCTIDNDKYNNNIYINNLYNKKKFNEDENEDNINNNSYNSDDNNNYNYNNNNNEYDNVENNNNNNNDNINNNNYNYNYNKDEENNNIVSDGQYLNNNNIIPNNESYQFFNNQTKPKITTKKKTVLPNSKNINNNTYNNYQNDSFKDKNEDDNYNNNNFIYDSNKNNYYNAKSSSEYSNEENQNMNSLRNNKINNNSESLKTISNNYDYLESNKNNNSFYNTSQLNGNSISSMNENIKKYINHPNSSNSFYENKSDKNTFKDYYNTKNSGSIQSTLSKRNNISSLKTIKYKYNKLYHKDYLQYIFKDNYMLYIISQLKNIGYYYKYYSLIYILKMLEQRIIKNMKQFCFFIIKGEGFVIKQNIFFNILKTYIKNTNLYINYNNDISKLLKKSNIEYYSNIYKNRKYIPYLRPTDEKNLINTQLFSRDIDFNNLILFICDYLKYEKNANDFSPEIIKYYLQKRPLKNFNIFTLTRYINSLHYILIFNSYNFKNIHSKNKNKQNSTYNRDILKSKNAPKVKEYPIKRSLSSDNNKLNNLKKLNNVYALKKKIGKGNHDSFGNSTYDNIPRFNHIRSKNNDNIINREIVSQIYEDYEDNKKYMRSKSINYEKLDNDQVKRHVTKCSSCNIENLLMGDINQANIPLVKKKFIYEKKIS